MGKKMTFTYEGEDYTLEFNRVSIKRLEKIGFSADKLKDAPITHMSILFNESFVMHHGKQSVDKTDDILEALDKGNSEEEAVFFNALTDMYKDAYDSIMINRPKEKKVSWKMK